MTKGDRFLVVAGAIAVIISFTVIGFVVIFAVVRHRPAPKQSTPIVDDNEMTPEREEYLRGLSERVLENRMTAEDIENVKRGRR